jgi:hypothetical protein
MVKHSNIKGENLKSRSRSIVMLDMPAGVIDAEKPQPGINRGYGAPYISMCY